MRPFGTYVSSGRALNLRMNCVNTLGVASSALPPTDLDALNGAEDGLGRREHAVGHDHRHTEDAHDLEPELGRRGCARGSCAPSLRRASCRPSGGARGGRSRTRWGHGRQCWRSARAASRGRVPTRAQFLAPHPLFPPISRPRAKKQLPPRRKEVRLTPASPHQEDVLALVKRSDDIRCNRKDRLREIQLQGGCGISNDARLWSGGEM